MPRHLAIETAYARNIADPLVLSIDGDDWHLDPSINIGSLAALFTRFQDGLAAMGDEAVPLDQKIGTMEAKRVEGINALTQTLMPDERQRFADYALLRIDVTTMANIVTWLLSEVGGQATPTPPPSSSNGSPADGAPSTAGALPEGSTLSPSQPTAP